MFARFHAVRSGLAVIGLAVTVAAAPTQLQAGSGTVRIQAVNAGFIFGGGGGRGVLQYRGRVYPFSVGGIGVAKFGVSAADLVGRAYYLRRPSDIAGTYTATAAGVAFVAGARVTRLRNANGVVLDLQGGQVGLELDISLNGMSIAMQ
ncbi:MAG TPA: hypothetical protein VH743_02360 [Beijerinckiaceae bacterium]